MSAIEQIVMSWRNDAQRPTYEQLMQACEEHAQLERLNQLHIANLNAITQQLGVVLRLASSPPTIDKESGKAAQTRQWVTFPGAPSLQQVRRPSADRPALSAALDALRCLDEIKRHGVIAPSTPLGQHLTETLATLASLRLFTEKGILPEESPWTS